MYLRCINKVILEFILIFLIFYKVVVYSGSCMVKSIL